MNCATVHMAALAFLSSWLLCGVGRVVCGEEVGWGSRDLSLRDLVISTVMVTMDPTMLSTGLQIILRPSLLWTIMSVLAALHACCELMSAAGVLQYKLAGWCSCACS